MKKFQMLSGPILKPMIAFAIPVLATGVLQQLFNSLDVILAGKLGTSGDNAVAAVGATTSVLGLLINFFAGCSAGSAVSVSHAIGSRKRDEVEKAVHTAMLLAFVVGLLVTVIGLSFSGMLLSAMGTPKNIYSQAVAYLRMRFLGVLPQMVYFFGAAILRTVGETKKPLKFLLISGPIKLILTVVFVAYLNLDVVGLALATSCAHIVSATMVLITLIKRNDDVKLDIHKLRFHAATLGKILRIGIPSGIQSSTFSLSNVILQSSVNSLSGIEGFIVGDAAAKNIGVFGDTVTNAVYQCALSFVGTNEGAKNYDRIKKCHIRAVLLSVTSVAILATFVLTFARQLLGFYISDSLEAIDWGVVRLGFIWGTLVLQAVMSTTTGTLRGMGYSLVSMIISLSVVCGGRVLWCLTLFQIPSFHNPYVLYAIFPITWFLSAVLQNVILAIVLKKKKLNTQKEAVG